jgi:nicotinamidase-related amidase
MKDETLDVLDTEHTALILVDLQLRIVGRQLAPHGGADVVRQSMRLAHGFHAKGGLVVVVQSERSGTVSQPPGNELVGEIAPQGSDLLITQHTGCAFHETDLHEKLQGRKIIAVAIAGIATNVDVESTARAAAEHGYRVILVEDAMASMDAAAHAFAITKVFPQLGTVCSADDLLSRLA